MATTLLGELRERLTVQVATLTTDTHGGRTRTLSTFCTTWGKCTAISGSERLQAETVGSHVRWRVEVPYRPDLTPDMRIVWTPFRASSAKTLEVLAVRPKAGRPDRLELDCGEVT